MAAPSYSSCRPVINACASVSSDQCKPSLLCGAHLTFPDSILAHHATYMVCRVGIAWRIVFAYMTFDVFFIGGYDDSRRKTYAVTYRRLTPLSKTGDMSAMAVETHSRMVYDGGRARRNIICD